MVYSDSDELIIVASTEGNIHFWYSPTDRKPAALVSTLDLHRSGSTIFLNFDANNNTLLSLGSDGRLYSWNLDIDELMQSSCDLLKHYLALDQESLAKQTQQRRSRFCSSSN